MEKNNARAEQAERPTSSSRIIIIIIIVSVFYSDSSTTRASIRWSPAGCICTAAAQWSAPRGSPSWTDTHRAQPAAAPHRWSSSESCAPYVPSLSSSWRSPPLLSPWRPRPWRMLASSGSVCRPVPSAVAPSSPPSACRRASGPSSSTSTRVGCPWDYRFLQVWIRSW